MRGAGPPVFDMAVSVSGSDGRITVNARKSGGFYGLYRVGIASVFRRCGFRGVVGLMGRAVGEALRVRSAWRFGKDECRLCAESLVCKVGKLKLLHANFATNLCTRYMTW